MDNQAAGAGNRPEIETEETEMKELVTLWYAKSKRDTPCRISVYPTTQQRPHGLPPITVYRSRYYGYTYPVRACHTWDDLTVSQKVAVFRDYYHAAVDDAKWRIAKDPDLAPQFKAWREQARKERDEAIAALKAGKPVDPPNLFV